MKLLFIASAVLITFAGSNAVAQSVSAGADGPTFPSITASEGAGVSRALVQAELAQSQDTRHALIVAGDGAVDLGPEAMVSTRTAAQVRVEAVMAANSPRSLYAPDGDSSPSVSPRNEYAQGIRTNVY